MRHGLVFSLLVFGGLPRSSLFRDRYVRRSSTRPAAARGGMLLTMGFGYLGLLAALALAAELTLAIYLGAGLSTAARLGASAARDGASAADVVEPRLERLRGRAQGEPVWSSDPSGVAASAVSSMPVGGIFGIEALSLRAAAALR